MTAPASERAVYAYDHAVAFVAGTQVFLNDDGFVEIAPVPMTDLAACADSRFVPPGGQWDDAARRLEDLRAIIVTGERGIGRRTAALRLLARSKVPGPLFELTPRWKRPRLQVLQPLATPGNRYLLDMSDPTDKPAPADFGKKLTDWANENGICLVVIAADDTGARRWAGSAGRAEVRLCSPNARELAAREFHLAGGSDLTLLDNPAFTDIWDSSPKAEDTRRLARLIAENPGSTPEDIADEYRGWRKWIDDNLPKKDFGTRTLMWAAAFCDGGQRKSVLRMSEDLRRRLDDERGPAAILSDTPSSARLTEAEIKKRDGGQVQLSPSQHGLAGALRTYLWDEFEDQALRDVLTDWLIAQLAELPFDDAELVADGVLDISIRFRDDALLRALRDKLTGEKRSIAVRTLSAAALDLRFGAHVRASLYEWARTSRSQADLVADVCGGAFGEQMPGMALVRLGWAAQNSQPGSPALASALDSLAGRHPEAVLASIDKWFADFDPPIAGINAFLALASAEKGARLLCAKAAPIAGNQGFRAVIGYFHRSLAEPASYETSIAVLKAWEKYSAAGALDPRNTINLLGKAIEPEFGKKTIERLQPGTWDPESFWGQVFKVALTGKDIAQEVEVDLRPDESAVPDGGTYQALDEQTDVNDPAHVPAAPAASSSEETVTGAETG